MHMTELVILVALEAEFPASVLGGNVPIEYTGVGKVNAALKTAEVIHKYQPKMIINFGTAGSLRPDLKDVLEVGVFMQRDMDASPLGFAVGETPFDPISVISHNEDLHSCGTGDSFVNSKPLVESDLVDMEAFAIAKACQRHDVAFRCFKYVSDNADEASETDWNENVAKGQKLFLELIKAEFGIS